MSEENEEKCHYLGCQRPLYEGKYCIFHSNDSKVKNDKFNEAFRKEFNRQKESKSEYNFSGFVFPKDISFYYEKFDKDAYFKDTKFYGKANFNYTQFTGVADFSGVQFLREVDLVEAKFFRRVDFEDAQFSGKTFFSGVQFYGKTSFRNDKFLVWADFQCAKFSNETIFEKTQFSGQADFKYVQFSRNIDFASTQFFEGADFSDAQFFEEANFFNAKFSREAYFTGAKFSGCAYFSNAQFLGEVDFGLANFIGNSYFQGIIFRDFQCDMISTYFSNVYDMLEYLAENRKKIKHPRGIKYLHKRCTPILGDATNSRLPLLSREIKDDIYLMNFKDKHPYLHFLWWLFADCGRSLWRWALWSLGFAMTFALIFNGFYQDYNLNFQAAHIDPDFPLLSFLYYSFVTFTTLGFGDIVPNNSWLQLLVALEVVIGYVMLGGLISILANKLARRS